MPPDRLSDPAESFRASQSMLTSAAAISQAIASLLQLAAEDLIDAAGAAAELAKHTTEIQHLAEGARHAAADHHR